MSERPHVRVEMLSSPLYLSGVRELVAAVAERLGFSEEAAGQIKLAVDEALCNVIRHGYEKRSDGPIWMTLWPTAEGEPGLRIVIEDEAKQVEPAEIRGRDLDEVRPGGLGVHIMNEVMDEVTYEKRETAGMRLTMVKRLPERAAAAGAESTPQGAA